MFFFVLSRLLFHKKQADSFTEKVSFNTRVKPWDIDSNMHLTNSRYLLYLDKGRVACMFNQGFFKGFIQHKIRPVVSSVNISFIRELKPLQGFDLSTQFVGWDDKYLYMSQEFSVEGKVHATSISRICPLVDGKILPPEEMLGLLDIDNSPIELPESVAAWKASLQTRAKGL